MATFNPSFPSSLIDQVVSRHGDPIFNSLYLGDIAFDDTGDRTLFFTRIYDGAGTYSTLSMSLDTVGKFQMKYDDDGTENG